MFARLQLQQQSQWAVQMLSQTLYLVNSLLQAAYEASVRLNICLQHVISLSKHVRMQLVAT